MDLLRLDREIESANVALTRWRARLSRGDETAWTEAPLDSRRDAQGKRLRDTLASLKPPLSELALRAGLVLWVETLTVARITAEAEVAYAQADHEAIGHLHLEKLAMVSAHDAIRGLVAASSRIEAQRYLDAIAECAPALREAAARLRETAREVRLRFAIDPPDAHGLGDGALLTAVSASARAFLRLTNDLAKDELTRRRRVANVETETWPFALDLSRARGATEGWPTRLSARFLDETFRPWCAGVKIPPLRLPEAHGGASFAIAFARFGQALRHAYAPRALPFVLRRPPVFVDTDRFGFLFASLLASARFSSRRLGLSQRVALAQSRAFAAAFLIEARRTAAKLSRLAGAPADELAHDVYDEIHPASALFFESTDVVASVGRALALFTVLPLHDELRDRHDEDWFDNPRSIVELRSRSAIPSSESAPAKGAESDLAKRFEDALR
ncbi:hypothetical protein BH09MYX1_BH09MYX1_58540 [soil metagenome]